MNSNLNCESTSLPGVLKFTPKVYFDARGYFFESFQKKHFENLTGLSGIDFVQDNVSHSTRGVIRGLHYQIPHSQGKWVRVLQGRVWDLIVDLRKTSPTFGQWEGFILSSENHQALWIPPGLAHGFLTLSESADLYYKATDFYSPHSERCLLWSDSTLNIHWKDQGRRHGVPEPFLLSEKDLQGLPLKDCEVYI